LLADVAFAAQPLLSRLERIRSAFFVILQTFVRKSMPYVFLVVEQIDKNSSYKLHLKLIAAVALPAL
jgi:hypothetical protein